jgi:single-strand DNA-binding protein
MRTIELVGRIAADAEKKISKNGKEYLSFRMANNEYNDEKGPDGKQKAYWFSVTSFNHLPMTQYLTKGKPVFVRGSYSDRVYQNRDGNCEIGRDIIATEISFLDFGGEKTQNTQTQSVPTTQTQMEAPKPTTAELKVPTPNTTVADDDDDLPF